MKKLLFLLPIVMLSLLMSSCKGDDGAMGPQGPPGVGYYLSGYAYPEANEWTVYGKDYQEDAYIEYSKSIPELNDETFEHGLVTGYVEKDNEKHQFSAKIPQYKANGELDFILEYSCSFIKGRIFFTIRFSDNIIRIPNKEIFYFVIVAEE